jgi:peptidoglycan/LPS O-acetylase OafA/YrhL
MRQRIAFVDMLRGLAALVVVFHHLLGQFPEAFAALPAALQRAAAWLSDRNGEAVLLFFVVSGFSIRLSVEALDLRRGADLDAYTYRRLKRILPLYLFALAFGAACVVVARVPVDPRALQPLTLLGNLLFLQTPKGIPGNWFFPFADNGPLWSLSYEMYYYALFPLHVRQITNPKLRFAAALAISAGGLVINHLWPNPLASFAAHYAIWYGGVEVAEAYLGHASTPWWLLGASWLALTFARFVVESATVNALWSGMTLQLIGLALVRWPILQRAGATSAARALVAGLAWVGGFSYALYLLHFPLVHALAYVLGPGLGAMSLAVLASVALASIAERLSLRPRYALLQRQYWS